MTRRLNLSLRMRTMLRRGVVATVGLLVLGLAAIVTLVASRDYAEIEREVISRIEAETGAVLTHRERRQSLWPRPHIVFSDIKLARPDGSFALTAREAQFRFDIRDLIDGRVDGPTIFLTGADITAGIGQLDRHFGSPRAMTDLADWFSGKFDRPGRFNRLTLLMPAARLHFPEGARRGETLDLAPVDLQLRYSARRSKVEFAARREGSANPFEISAALPIRGALAAGKPRAASFSFMALGSRLAFAGTARRDPDMALVGRLEASIGDVMERWILDETGTKRPLVLEPTTISANLTLDPRGIGFDSLQIVRAAKQLNGIAAMREIDGRWGLSATLAGDLLDGTSATRTLQKLRTPDQAWSNQPLALNPLPGLDLDIRVSTKAFKLADLVLSNVALSILTRKGRAEYAIADSRLGNGTLKLRMSVVQGGADRQDLRLNLVGDRLDMSAFLGSTVGFNRVGGTGNLVLQAEGGGRSVADIVGALNGSGALELTNGEIRGIDLQKLLARAGGGNGDAALLIALGGKTAFEHLKINVALKAGRIEPVGSSFTSEKVTARLEGVTDVRQQSHDLALFLQRRTEVPGQPQDFYAFRMRGALFAPSFKPDLKLLNRS